MTKRGVIRQIADLIEVDPKSVRNALALASIPQDLGGRSVEEVADIVKAIVDPARVSGHAATRVGKDSSGALSDARTQFERLKARRLEIENAKAEGKLIDREAVTETGAHIIASARTALLSLGYRLAGKVAGKTDLGEIAKLIENEVRTVLGKIADPDAFLNAVTDEILQ